jgi:flagellin
MSQSFRINTNVGALKAYDALSKLNASTQKAQLRLATQKRINTVADDTSGFNVGKSLDSKVTIMQSAQRNVGSAQDMLATAESQLISIKDMITQIRGKVADSSNPAADSSAIAKDIASIGAEIESAFATTKFNNTSLLQSVSDGAGAGFTFQTGASSSDTISITYGTDGTVDLVGTADSGSGTVEGVSTAVKTALDALLAVDDGTTETANATAIAALDLDDFESAIDDSLGAIGNYQQRLSSKQDFLSSAISNSQSAYSRLFDADVALESLNATKSQIGSQAASAMFSQLNFAPQQALQLFG